MFDRRHWPSRLCLLLFAVAAAGQGVSRAEMVELPVPRMTIYPGDVIAAEMLGSKAIELQDGGAGLTRSSAAAIGKVARRTLVADKPIPTAYLAEPQVVRQGKSVRIFYSESGLTISGVGLALQAGSVGDAISVRNVDSGAVIRGIVEGDGSVRIAGP
jgi:flagella basal body P-ring formation protein FlgA